MGNKFSVGNYIIYCGFPEQRRRFKQREVEMLRQVEAREASAAFQRAKKFKAEYPEYCRMAGIESSGTGVQHQSGMEVEARHRNGNTDSYWSKGMDARNKWT